MTDSHRDNPTISVLMPVYNGSRFLRAAVDSILNQTFRDFEFLCVDDGSTDESPAILQDYARRDPRVKIIAQANAGVTPALNAGLRAARGEFIARMDADDISLPERFEKQIAYLRSHPQCVLVGSQVLMVDPDGWPIYPKRDTSYEHPQILEALLDKGWPIVHPSVMIRTEEMRSVGGYDEQYRAVQDHDLFVRLAERGQLANLRDVLLHYRQHFDAISFARAQLQADALRQIVRVARAKRGLPMPAKLEDATPRDRAPAKCRQEWVWAATKSGYPATARKHALALLRQSPWRLDSWKLMGHALTGGIGRSLPPLSPLTPSRGIPGEGWGEGLLPDECRGPLPIPLPEYRARGPERTNADAVSHEPAISVLMPIYNAERYLAGAIESVLAQTLGDFELIAVDDGSRDQSLVILKQFAAADARVRVISRPNTGIVGALNDGLAAARGKYVARMDGDDLCLPERFAKQAAYLDAHCECVLVGSQVLLIDAEGDPICPHPQTRYTHEEIDRDHLHRGWPMVHPAIMMRREAVERIGRYRQEYLFLEDTDLFLRLAEVGKLANLPEILLHYRLHFQSICHTRHDVQGPLKQKLYEETWRRRGVAAKGDHFVLPRDKTGSEVHRMWAWWSLRAGNIATARKHALQSFRQAPFSAESWRLMACAVRGH